MSINLPAIHGTIKELIPKHWEYKAIAVPWYLIGEEFIIEAEADGRNIHREIVRGINAISINRYPSIKKLESEKEFIEESLEERLEPLQISENNEVIVKSVDHHKFIQRKEY